MRIIPKDSKVKLEFFKGFDLIDVAIALFGMTAMVALFVSNLPFNFYIMAVVGLFFVAILFPIEKDEKAYMFLISFLTNLSRYKSFQRKKFAADKAPGIEDITPFTGIDGEFIEYDRKYYGTVVEVESIEFKFLTLTQQNSIIERNLGSVLRGVTSDGSASVVKIDRPVIYDEFVKVEQDKIERIKQSYLNGLLSEEELTERVAIIRDRIDAIEYINTKDKVYIPFYYIVFCEKKKPIAKERAIQALSSFEEGGIPAKCLSGKDLAVFLKYNYTMFFDEREVERLDPSRYMDWILPKNIEFTARTVSYDGLITHNLRITDYPLEVANAWGHTLFNLPNCRVTMKMSPVDRYKSIKRIDRAIDELRGQGDNTSKTSRIIELSQHIDTLSELLLTLQGDNEKMFDVNIFITLYDYEMTNRIRTTGKGTAPHFKQDMRRKLSELNFRSSDMFLQQFEAYAAGHISGYDPFIKKSRGIHSNSIAAAFPFVFKNICDEGGFAVGQNGDVPVFVNFFKRDKNRVNSNMVIIGKSGSGKSYATKTLLANLAAEDSKIFILDPENEYSVLAKNMSGKVLDVGSATQGRINPFHIITTADDDMGNDDDDDYYDDDVSNYGNTNVGANVSFNTHLQFLEEFFRQILPGIKSDAMEHLNNLLVKLYADRGITQFSDLSVLTAKDFPNFDELYDKIDKDLSAAVSDYARNNLQILLNYVSKFAKGGRNAALWNGESTIDTSENFVVFNFQSLLANKNNIVANAQMLLVLKWLDNEIIKNRDYNLRTGASRRIIVVIDEAHVFIDDKYPIALDFMFQLAKRIRKYNGMQIVITQNIKDFVGTEEIAKKSTAIINACQYSFIFPLAPNDMHDLAKLYEKAGGINESEQDEIVNNGRGRAFVVTSPQDRTCIDIIATNEVKEMFTE